MTTETPTAETATDEQQTTQQNGQPVENQTDDEETRSNRFLDAIQEVAEKIGAQSRKLQEARDDHEEAKEAAKAAKKRVDDELEKLEELAKTCADLRDGTYQPPLPGMGENLLEPHPDIEGNADRTTGGAAMTAIAERVKQIDATPLADLKPKIPAAQLEKFVAAGLDTFGAAIQAQIPACVERTGLSTEVVREIFNRTLQPFSAAQNRPVWLVASQKDPGKFAWFQRGTQKQIPITDADPGDGWSIVGFHGHKLADENGYVLGGWGNEPTTLPLPSGAGCYVNLYPFQSKGQWFVMAEHKVGRLKDETLYPCVAEDDGEEALEPAMRRCCLVIARKWCDHVAKNRSGKSLRAWDRLCEVLQKEYPGLDLPVLPDEPEETAAAADPVPPADDGDTF